jgi:hypothetical protein
MSGHDQEPLSGPVVARAHTDDEAVSEGSSFTNVLTTPSFLLSTTPPHGQSIHSSCSVRHLTQVIGLANAEHAIT